MIPPEGARAGRAAGRLLVTGASGTLGGPLTREAIARGWEVTGTYLTRPERMQAGDCVQLDLRDSQAVTGLVSHLQPDVIIHTAVTERSGSGFPEAIRLAARHIAHSAAACGARLIAMSTDLVFDGTADHYTEDDAPRVQGPQHAYADAKLAAEQDILARYPQALVVRTSLIYDFESHNPQLAWTLAAIDRGEKVPLYVDQIRCPIWVWNLAGALLELAELDASGVLHVVGPEPISRYRLGVALLEAAGIDPAAHVVPATAPDHQPRTLNLPMDRARVLLKNTPWLTVEKARARWETSKRSGQ